MESWLRLLPDYEFKEWNKFNSPMDVDYMQAAYDRRLWSKVSNYVRLHALYTEGGIYLDLDMELIKSLDPLLSNDCFLGFQIKKKCKEWVNNAILGAITGHHFTKNSLDTTIGIWRKYGEFYRSPMVTTLVLKKNGLEEYGEQTIEGVKIYPFEYFYPFNWKQSYSPDYLHEETYSIHYWEMNWRNPKWLSRQQQDLLRIARNLFSH
jgi:mannosyltransferase OCH1-like enzyme